MIKYIIISFFLINLIYLIGIILRMKNVNKGIDSYECGFLPIKTAHNPFSLHFFLLGILFIIFDLEIILLFPLISKFTFFGWLITLILLLSLFYEWNLGTLNWV